MVGIREPKIESGRAIILIDLIINPFCISLSNAVIQHFGKYCYLFSWIDSGRGKLKLLCHSSCNSKNLLTTRPETNYTYKSPNYVRFPLPQYNLETNSYISYQSLVVVVLAYFSTMCFGLRLISHSVGGRVPRYAIILIYGLL